MGFWCPVTGKDCNRTTCTGAVCDQRQELSAQSATLLGRGLQDAREGRVKDVVLPPDRIGEACNKWRARIKKLNEIQATEIAYARHRLDELDAHGLWDSGVAAEWAIERDRLIACIQDLGEEV